MSAGGAGVARGSISVQKVNALGIVGGLAGIYLAYFVQLKTGATTFAFLGAIGAICAVVWGADAVRRVCSYGLGTGVPSIGMLALGMGIIAATMGLALGTELGIPAGPVLSLAVAGIIGFIIGMFANKVLGMGIPIMEKAMTEIAGAGALVIVGMSVAMTGTFAFDAVLTNVIATGYIAVIFIAGGMAILHPFNANLGPDEAQDRTLTCAVEKGAIAMVVSGIVGFSIMGVSALATIVIGLLIWVVYFAKYYGLVVRDAHKVVGSGLLPTEEELA